MINNILFLAYEIWFNLLLITSIKKLLLLLLLLLLHISWVFPHTTKNTLKYVVDRGILWKLEVALGQQMFAQDCHIPSAATVGLEHQYMIRVGKTAVCPITHSI
jgi:hypothetical protein